MNWVHSFTSLVETFFKISNTRIKFVLMKLWKKSDSQPISSPLAVRITFCCVIFLAAGAREDAVPHATERPNGARLPQVQRGQYQIVSLLIHLS